jgi:hypothetical protein
LLSNKLLREEGGWFGGLALLEFDHLNLPMDRQFRAAAGLFVHCGLGFRRSCHGAPLVPGALRT